MKNKLTNNDPRLTAYAFGELPRDEAEEISHMLNAGENLPIKREVENIDALGVMLTQTLSAAALSEGKSEPQLKLSAAQRDAIFRSAKAPTVDDVSSAHQSRWLRPVLVTLGAAALVTFSFMMLDRVESDELSEARLPDVSFSELSEDKLHSPILPNNSSWKNSSGGISSVSSNASSVSSQMTTGADNSLASGVSIGESEENLAKLIENDWISRADSAVARMPMVCGKASWNWVSQSIILNQSLPNKNAIRVEEIINAFDYNVSSDLELKHASIGVDLVRCPWNDTHLIAVILVENKHQEKIQVEAAVSFSSAVNKYRVVGYARAESRDSNVMAPEKITMAVGDAHLVMYEIVPEQHIENAADILSLNIRTTVEQANAQLRLVKGNDNLALINDEKTLDLQFSERAWTKTSQDMQFALLLASWSQLISESAYSAQLDASSMQEMLSSFERDFIPTAEQLKAIKVLKKGIDLIK